MKTCFLTWFILSATVYFLYGQQKRETQDAMLAYKEGGVNRLLSEKMESAWNVTWQRFYLPKTRLFYDYLSSYESGKELSHLPKAEEVMRQYPNRMGYDTGMENCMISAGVLMDMVVDRYAVTNDESLREKAFRIFEGIKLCATVHGIDGFLARGVCPEDGKSVYVTSSRDQYTYAVYGLWVYYHSQLCDQATKKEIREIIIAIAERCLQNVVLGNNYDLLSADGKQSDHGLCKMWEVLPHEAARLPMIYAAAWDITGNEKYYHDYKKYLNLAIDQSYDLTTQSTAFPKCKFRLYCLKISKRTWNESKRWSR